MVAVTVIVGVDVRVGRGEGVIVGVSPGVIVIDGVGDMVGVL